ncbi:universal stress protein A-like protein [Carex littledalei]|uniref:Universal stress protein A-like protein n=1 Tax=Carex littledalei TaxID=544730 RepID=A0A833VHM7_9POAL|nr:universal stress protein A-like protein [Carex littledalei]
METINKKVVMVAVDESQESLYALSWAIDHLFTVPTTSHEVAAGGTSLVVMHAQPPVHNYIHSVGPAVCATPFLVESVKQAQEESSRDVLNKALHICNEKGVRAETIVVQGDAKEMICQTAEQMNADVLVVGGRHLGALKRALLGSVSDYCAHHASCPVLIVKPPKPSTS